MSLFGGVKAETPASEAETAGVEVAGAPPLPARDVRKRPKSAPSTELASATNPKEEKHASLTLPSLSDVKLFSAAEYAPDSANWEGGPVDVYTQLAQEIRACWFTPGKSKLTNHGFYADVLPDDKDNAKIIIYEKDPEGRRGVQAFRIDISGSAGGSTVKSENRRLDKALDLAFKSDLARWSKGEQGCKG